MDERRISLCLTNWNRCDLLIESFSKVLDDERISQIHIQDDASDLPIFQQVKAIIEVLNQTHGNKITYERNLTNCDCYENKYRSVLNSKTPFCILLDSDNTIDKDYLDRLYEIPEWDKHTAYMPSFAKPLFNYEAYEGITFTKENIADYISMPMVSTCLNCMNYFFNAAEYIRVWQSDINPHTADSILQNYNWLNAGNGIYIVPSLHYNHLVHDDSHYKRNVHLTGSLYSEIEQKIKQFK